MTSPYPEPSGPKSFIDLLRISDGRYAPIAGSEQYVSQEEVEQLHEAISQAKSAAEEAKRHRDSVWGTGAEQAISQAVSRYQSLAQQAVDNRVSVWEHERGDRIYAPITGSTVYATKREYSEIIDAWNEAKEYADIARDNADASGQAQVFAGQAEQSSLSASQSAQQARDARPQWSGEWNPSRNYNRSSFVSYKGVTYYALEASTGRRPDESTDHWQAVAERGAPGIVISETPPENGEVWLNPSGDTDAFDLEEMANEAAQSVLSSKSDVGHTHTLNDIVGTQFTDNATPNAIAKRDSNGQLTVPAMPTRDDFAASKVYVDNAKREAIDQVNVVGNQVNSRLDTAVQSATTAAADAAIPAVRGAIANEVANLESLVWANAGRIMGTGSPEDVQDSPIGTIYVDTSNGVLYAKTTVEGMKNGWGLLYGDTGWREVQLINGWTGSLYIRRIGDIVYYRGKISAAGATAAYPFDIPTGFKVSSLISSLGGGYDYGSDMISTDATTPVVRRVGFYLDRFTVSGYQNSETYFVSVSYPCQSTWPTSLPGFPA